MKKIKWICLIPLWIIVNILAMIFSRFFVMFAKSSMGPCDNNNDTRDEPRLPWWLSWFMTPDNSLYGDYGWRTEHRPNDWQTPKGMAAWLQRNPGCGFDLAIAAKIKPDSTLTWEGDPFVQDGPAGKEGKCVTKVDDYFHYYSIKRFGKLRCLKVDIGWNLKTYAEQPERIKTQPKASYTISIRTPIFRG